MQTITLGILETGLPPEQYQVQYGSYPDMFRHLLSDVDQKIDFKYFPILDGDIPTDPAECDAWLITGSKFGVYEDHPWIQPLSQLIQRAFAQDIPFIGICFGHQLIAQALGGKVIKSDKGWSLGVNQYRITQNMPWMENDETEFSIQAYHQDQVVQLPAETEVIAASDFCPYAALNFADKAISFQGHPEFSADYTEKLLSNRRDLKLLPTELANQAIADINAPVQSSQVARWICSFLRQKL